MAHRQDETLVSRSDLRDAIRDDLLVALKAGEIKADPSIDGAPVLTIPALNAALEEVFSVPLAPPSDRHAEVKTGATVVVHVICPECGLSAKTIAYLSSELLVDDASAELRVKMKTKGKTHVHGQQELPDAAEGQTTIDDVLAGQPEGDAPEEADPTSAPDDTTSDDSATPDASSETPSTDDAGADDALLPDDTKNGGTCPYPECARAIDHRGKHRDADGKVVGG